MEFGKIRFTDSKGVPVSKEYFEDSGFTQGMQLPGQCMILIKLKEGIIVAGTKLDSEEEAANFARVAFRESQSL